MTSWHEKAFRMTGTMWGQYQPGCFLDVSQAKVFNKQSICQCFETPWHWRDTIAMGLLPDTQNCGCACAGNAGNVFPVTACKRSRHASRHVREARAVMHAGIANYRFHLKSAAGENVPGIPGACATCNFTYLVRGPWNTKNFKLALNNGMMLFKSIFKMRE